MWMLSDPLLGLGKQGQQPRKLFGPETGAQKLERASSAWKFKRPASPHTTPKPKAKPAAATVSGADKPQQGNKEMKSWSLKSLAAFDDMLASRSIHDACLEPSSMVQILEAIPARLRMQAGLPHKENLTEADVTPRLEQDAAKVAQLHSETQAYWLAQAEKFSNETLDFALDESATQHGLLFKMAQHETFPAHLQGDRLKELLALADMDASEQSEAAELQRSALAQLIPSKSAILIFDAAVALMEASTGKTSPAARLIKDVLLLVPEDVRTCLDLPKPERYRSIKRSEWREDVNTILSLAFAGLASHWEAEIAEIE